MEKFIANPENKGVFVIYTGGTIGSMPKDPNDPDSPQIVVDWETFMKQDKAQDFTEEKLGFRLGSYSTQPLDSCNIGPAEWKEMADAIKKNYNDYEGFVILHGTDTMVYTASALSFMLQNLAKPVIITGAQLAFLFNPRNDGFQNMLTALLIANPNYTKIPVIPEVCIYFSGKLFRGNRARKINASGYDAYQSPNYAPLAIAGESIQVDERLIRKIPQNKAFTTQTKLEKNVVAVNFFPGIQDGEILQKILTDKALKGVVLMAYGSGNIPTKHEIMQLLKETTARGVVAYVVTQCGGGKVELGMYETSALLLEAGVVSGVDITPEAALTKLMVLLGDEDMNVHDIALRTQQNLAGEQSLSIYTTEFKKDSAGDLSKDVIRKRIPAENIQGLDSFDNADRISKIMLRFRNGRILNSNANEAVEISLFIDMGSDDELNENSPNYLGTFKKAANGTESMLFFDITEKSRKILSNRASFTIKLKTPTGLFTWSSLELVLFVSDL